MADDIQVHCVFESEIREGERLYEITNIDDIMSHPSEYERFLQWLTQTHKIAVEQEKEIHLQKQKKEKQNRNQEFDENKLV